MAESPSGKIFYEIRDRIFRITFNHTEDNIIDIELMQDLITLLGTEVDSSSADAVILEGSGKKSFSMGYDGSCIRLGDRKFVKDLQGLGYTISRMMKTMQIPIVSKINGFALGMGMEIAMSSDFITASTKSRLGMPDLRFGLPSFTGILGEIRADYGAGAYNRIISGEIIAAEEAKSLGIVSMLAAEPDIDEATDSFLKNLNTDLVVFYKSQNSSDQRMATSERMFFDLYDLSKIRLKELESFRKSLVL